MTDDKILDLYWGRDETAITESDKQYGKYCYSIAYRILSSHEDSEECINETWLNAWHAIPPQRPGKLSLFLGRITRNLSFDKFRANRTAKRGGGEIVLILDELNECVPSANSTEQVILNQELGKTINRFLQTLPDRECSVFLARYWYSYPLRAISAQFCMTENNVKASLFRSGKKLKTYLEKEDITL